MLRCVALLTVGLALASPNALAQSGDDGGVCRVMEVEFTPTDDLQIAVWIETAAGDYVDTVFLTDATGRYGLGNRPGRMDFNSGPMWPYGRRLTVAPVWAHRHGEVFPTIVFQNGDESNLSHPLSQSSLESHYCRPLREGEEQWDTETCASVVYTDKGKFLGNDAVYPPRSDISKEEVDHPDVDIFGTMNPFDAVSRATPPGGEPFDIRWRLPPDLADGSYVAYVEVSKEFDFNESYNQEGYPEPVGIPWGDYGLAYRGQPSVVYRVDFEIRGEEPGIYTTAQYAGYGDPGVFDQDEFAILVGGDLYPPDGTISEGVDGSGASRLLLEPADDVSDAYRIRIKTRPNSDVVAPGALGQLEVLDTNPTSATASFIAPGNDGTTGIVAGYDVRISASGPITAETFESAQIATVNMDLVEGGSVQNLTLVGLAANTRYYVAVRAFDECVNIGDIAFFEVTTERFANGSVSACGCHTTDGGSTGGMVALLGLVLVAVRRRR